MPNAERMLISAILRSGDNSHVKKEGLKPSDLIFHKAQFDYVIKNGVPSKLMFKAQFPEFKIVKADEKDIPGLVTMVRKERVKHEIAKAIEQTLKDVDERNPMDLARRLGGRMDKIMGMFGASQDVDIINQPNFIMSDFRRRRRMKDEGRQVGIETGIPTIDKETGGLSPGELWVCVGRQGVGKTWITLDFAASCKMHGKSVLFISLEMPPELIAYRVHTLIWAKRHPKKKHNRFDNMSLLRGEANPKRYKAFLENIRKQAPAKFIVPQLSSNFVFTTSTVNAKIEEHHPDVVFIDYIGLMQSDTQGGKIDNWQEISQQIKELKQMALMYSIPIIVNAQANRAAADSREAPKLHQISNSDAIGATADRVISLFALPSGKLRISIEKNRYGRQNFAFDVKWNINEGMIRELPAKLQLKDDD